MRKQSVYACKVKEEMNATGRRKTAWKRRWKIRALIKPPASTFTGGLNLIHIQWNVPHFPEFVRLKQLEFKAYVLGGLYLAFLKVLNKVNLYASGGPYLSFLDYKLWTYVFGGLTPLFFIFKFLLFYELTITDYFWFVNK